MQRSKRFRVGAVLIALLLVAAAVAQQVTTIQGQDAGGVRRIVLTDNTGQIITAGGGGFGPDPLTACDESVPIGSAGAGTTQLVAGAAGETIYICHISLSWSAGAAVDWRLITGTNANCAAGAANLTNDYENVNAMALDFGPAASLRTPAAAFLCMVQTGAGTAGGVLSYAQGNF